MNKFNTQRLQEYAAVFGNAKIRRLWDEFLTVSARNWDNFEQKTPDADPKQSSIQKDSAAKDVSAA